MGVGSVDRAGTLSIGVGALDIEGTSVLSKGLVPFRRGSCMCFMCISGLCDWHCVSFSSERHLCFHRAASAHLS